VESPNKINIATLVDHSRLGLFQWTTFVLCGLCLIMDGFDVQAMGYVAPAVIREFKIPGAQMGLVFSAALLGVLLGSFLFSMLSDRVGRRPVLIIAALYFAVLTLWTARASSAGELLAIRFIAGFGLGGIMPNAMALAGEYSPSRHRVTVMMLVSNFFTVGAAIGGFIAAGLIPRFGWRSVFIFGGIVPLIISVLMIFLLPESLQFMVLRGKSKAKILKWLKRINAPLPPGEFELVAKEENRAGVPVVNLFREGRGLGTVMLWIINFMNLLNLYFLGSWLPTVVRDAGYTTAIAVLVGTAMQVGGSLGTIPNGWMIDRFGFRNVLTIVFGVATISIAMIGQPSLPLSMLFFAAFVAGWCVPGGQPGVNSLAAMYYPTYLRSTGIGASLGFGRIGAIVGPLAAGALLGKGWAHRELFLAAAVPALLSAVATYALRWVMPEPKKAAAPVEVLVH
jgi:AAHS family 4-hydroxybenzoate transporter-like MFS transporter